MVSVFVFYKFRLHLSGSGWARNDFKVPDTFVLTTRFFVLAIANMCVDYCLLHIAYCLSHIACCLLPIVYCIFPIANFLFPIAHGLFPIDYMSHIAYRLSPIAYYPF